MGYQGVIRVCRSGPAVRFQVEGRATMHQSLPLRREAEQALAAGATALRVDLRRCTYMDSTFMGILLYFVRLAGQCAPGGVALVCPSPQCQRLFRDMGLDKFFPVVAEEELPADAWTQLCCELDDVGSFQGNVVQAHRELATLPGPTGEAFREVLEGLPDDAHE